ncbi:MAG: hypothetical protein QGG65_06230 [Gammaproteobacteria bacterium]|jgi:hypothetical protein|nr:hypothetical protein [Gammaproteobacteria bacterium]MDP7270920.1 hypothetical protein [Gammaproteobacteria bacterium]HJP05568.1 hypothetical protein [Gammaproteobacteria bacterium]
MPDTKSAIESLMGERGRLRTAHEMLKAALDTDTRDYSFVPFYVAVANYMEASMGRLNEQDIKMLGRLREKLGNATPEEEEIIAEVHRRLDGNREHLKKFLACRTALASNQNDDETIADYEETSHAYVDYIHNRMGHHAPSTDIARRLFDESDWIDIADIDEEYFVKEKELYKELLKTRPESVPLGMAAEEYVEQYRSDRG